MKESFEDQDALVDGLNQGNKLAYKYLYSLYYNELCVYANSLLNDSLSAEDLVQSVMVKIWNKKPDLIIKTSLKSYLYKSVYNHFINNYRLKQKELTFIEEMKANAIIHLAEEDDDIINEKIRNVKNEIENLPAKCKNVFLMNKMRGMKYKEIADELNLSVKTVEAHISKALFLIKERLKKSRK